MACISAVAMKQLVDECENRDGNWTAAEEEAYDKMHASLTATDERIREIETHTRKQAVTDEARKEYDQMLVDSDRNRTTGGEYRAGTWLANELESRGLVGSGLTGGGSYTPSDQAKTFFDLLTAKSVALQSGFRQIRTMRDSVIIPRLTADVGANWTAEAAAIVQTSLTADQVTVTPSKLTALEQLSNEVINDSDPQILDIAAASMVRSMSLKLDLGLFEGAGAPGITGLKNTAGIQTFAMGANGAIPTNLDFVADAIGLAQAANANPDAIYLNPRTWRTLLKIKTATAENKALLQDEQGGASAGPRFTLYGLPVFVSSQLAVTETQGSSGAVASSAYVVDTSQCHVVMRQDLTIEKDSSRLFNTDQSELRAIARIGFGVSSASAIVRVTGILA